MKKSRAASAAKTGKFLKLPFRSAHVPSQSGIHHISRMLGDGAREQTTIAENKLASAKQAIGTQRRVDGMRLIIVRGLRRQAAALGQRWARPGRNEMEERLVIRLCGDSWEGAKVGRLESRQEAGQRDQKTKRPRAGGGRFC